MSAPLPDNNPKTASGRTKPPVHAIPPTAILALGLAMENGEGKYGLMNWRQNAVSSSVYYDALLRHLMAWWDGEDNAPDSGIPHLGHVLACAAILVDAQICRRLNDDRPPPGPTADFIAHLHAQRVAAAQPAQLVETPDPAPSVAAAPSLLEALRAKLGGPHADSTVPVDPATAVDAG